MQTLDGLLEQLQKLKADGVDGGTPVVYQDGDHLDLQLVAPGAELVTAEQAMGMTDDPGDIELIGDAEQVIVL